MSSQAVPTEFVAAGRDSSDLFKHLVFKAYLTHESDRSRRKWLRTRGQGIPKSQDFGINALVLKEWCAEQQDCER